MGGQETGGAILNQYAIVVTDTGFGPGINAMLNALLYYDMGEIHFHHLFWPGTDAADAVREKQYEFYPNYRAVPLTPDLLPPEYTSLWADAPNCCYHSRWAYAARLTDYSAVSIMDADILLCNDIRSWFEVAAQTDFLLLPDNDYSGYSNESYDLRGIQGDASVPWHNMPAFWSPAVWGDFMAEIPLIGLAEKRSDICMLNRLLIQRGLLDRILTLSNSQWLSTHYYNLKLIRRDVGNKRYLALHENGDRLNAVHRRWWMESICRQFITDITEGPDRDRGRENIHLFWDFYRFFNTECEHKLDYPFVWPEDA